VYLNDLAHSGQNATTLLFSIGIDDYWTLNLFILVNVAWLIYFFYRIAKTACSKWGDKYDYPGVCVLFGAVNMLPLIRLLMVAWYLVAYFFPEYAYLESQVSFWLPATATIINHIVISACLIFLLERLHWLSKRYLVDSDLETSGYNPYGLTLLGSNVLLATAVFTALFYYRPFGQIMWFYARSDDAIYPITIPTGANKIFHLLMTGLYNISFCFIAFGLDKMSCAVSDLALYEKLSEAELNMMQWARHFCNYVVLYMIGTNVIEWVSTYWNYGILSALAVTFYANMLMDFIPINLVLSDVSVYNALYKEKVQDVAIECTSVQASQDVYHDDSSQSTSDEASA